MRLFMRLLSILFFAIIFAVSMHLNAGNVVFFYPPYRLDLSLNFFLLLAVLLIAFFYFLLSTIRAARKMPAWAATYRQEKQERKNNQAFYEAIKALFEGRFGHAEKAAKLATGSPRNAGLVALIGARAAHRLGQPERQEYWLETASNDPSLKTACLMTRLELSVEDRHIQPALDTVAELNNNGTRSIHALRLILKTHQYAKNWGEVLRLVRLLDKHKALHPALSARLRELAYKDLLSTKLHDQESLKRIWSSIPAAERIQSFIASQAARAFYSCGLYEDAHHILEEALIAGWNSALIETYVDVAANEGSPALRAQIEHCETWHGKHPGDAELALALGSLCFKQKLWGKSQEYLHQAVSVATRAKTLQGAHLKLAQLHERLQQPDQAAMHYRQCALTLENEYF